MRTSRLLKTVHVLVASDSPAKIEGAVDASPSWARLFGNVPFNAVQDEVQVSDERNLQDERCRCTMLVSETDERLRVAVKVWPCGVSENSIQDTSRRSAGRSSQPMSDNETVNAALERLRLLDIEHAKLLGEIRQQLNSYGEETEAVAVAFEGGVQPMPDISLPAGWEHSGEVKASAGNGKFWLVNWGVVHDFKRQETVVASAPRIPLPSPLVDEALLQGKNLAAAMHEYAHAVNFTETFDGAMALFTEGCLTRRQLHSDLAIILVGQLLHAKRRNRLLAV